MVLTENKYEGLPDAERMSFKPRIAKFDSNHIKVGLGFDDPAQLSLKD